MSKNDELKKLKERIEELEFIKELQQDIIIDFEKVTGEELSNLPGGSYALPKFFDSLIHKHLLHDTVVDSLAKPF